MDSLRAMRTGFPDMVCSIQEQVTENDNVVSRFEWTGTRKGDSLGIPATGRPVRVWGIVLDRLEDGRIKDTRIIMDTLGMMGQLGVLPGPAASWYPATAIQAPSALGAWMSYQSFLAVQAKIARFGGILAGMSWSGGFV
jgi:hypothetical protein